MLYRPLTAIFAVAMTALVCTSLAKAEDCGKKQTHKQAQDEIFTESERASIVKLEGPSREAFLAHLYSLGMPKAPDNDEIWVAKWNDADNSASILAFKSGCRQGLVNGLPLELLLPGLGEGA